MREVLKFTSVQFGLMESFFMGGALLGNVLIAVKFGRKAGSFLFKAMFINGIVMMVFIWLISPASGLDRNEAFALLMAVSIIMGTAEAFIDIPIQSKIQRAVPSEVRGRVFSALGILTRVATPLGLVLVGPLLNLYPAWLVALGIWLGMAFVVVYYWVKYRDVLLADVDEQQKNKGEAPT